MSDIINKWAQSGHAHRDQISRCDKMDGAITHLRDEVKGLREVLIASLFAQMKVLSNTGFLPKDDTLVDVRERRDGVVTGATARRGCDRRDGATGL